MKIIVVGAGLQGLTTAYFLNQHGHSVVVIDRQNGPGLETSFANGGMLTPSQSAPWNNPEMLRNVFKLLCRDHGPLKIHPATFFSSFPWMLNFIKNSSVERFFLNQRKNLLLAQYSLHQMRILREELSLKYDLGKQGTLKIFRSVDDMNRGVEFCKSLHNTAINFDVITRDEIQKLEPALETVIKSIFGGIYFPDDESGDAYKFCQSIYNKLTPDVEFIFNTNVISLVRKNDRITGIETSKGLISSDTYVLAAGSYSKSLGSSVGLKIPIEPVKGYSVTVSLACSDIYPKLPVIDESKHIAITPFSNRFRIAGMAELCGFDTHISMNRINTLVEFLKELYPQLSDDVSSVDIIPWSGLRPYCCDGVPVLGDCEIRNLYLNTGHGHLGWTMSVGSSRLVTDQMLEKQSDIDRTPYHINRF